MGEGNYDRYMHHGAWVSVRKDLKGKHREMCLCFSCCRFNLVDRRKCCHAARDLYKLCVKYNLVTPVFECPEFERR